MGYNLPNNINKPTILCILFIAMTFVSWSQVNLPVMTTSQPPAPAVAPTPVPAASAAGTPVNYIRVFEAKGPLSDEASFTTQSYTAVQQSTTYLDGIGRPLQTVIRQNTPSGTDVVSPVVYDPYGREQYKYLPYPSAGVTGAFRPDPFNEQKTFMQTQFPGEQVFYSKTDLESSPLNTVLKTYAQGNSWAGNNKGVQQQPLVNTAANDAVKIWTIPSNTNFTLNIPVSSITPAAIYADGQLYKSVSVDEAGNAVVEYKDKGNKVILKKVQIGTIAADYSGFTGFLSTYYIYDDLGQLRFVMPPKAIAKLPANGVLTTDIINELCFRYEYDSRQRMIAKKIPGAGWMYMIYDNRDRLVFSQDANLAVKNQWLYTLYDDLNRPVQTGIISYSTTWSALQAYVSALSCTTNCNTIINSSGSYVPVIGTMYLTTREQGRLTYQASNSIVFQNGFVSEDNASITAAIVPDPGLGFTNTSTTINTNPVPSGATVYPLTYAFFDNYSWTTKDYVTTDNASLDDGGNAYPETLPAAKSTLTRGMATGARIRVIEDPTNLTLGKWLETASFFDDKGRVVQVSSNNYKGGTDVVTNRYDFTGKIVSNYLLHNNAAGNIINMKVRSSSLYDFAGRVLKITEQINNANTRIITQNQYNNLGQLLNKQIGQKNVGGVFSGTLENQDYAYNIRGWLKGINWDYSQAAKTQPKTSADKWFAMDLSYDWGYSVANQLNGNIAGIRWMADGDGEERSYGFQYDKANRFLKGDFTRNINNAGSFTKDAIINFDAVMGDGTAASSAYDENGNIIAMKQTGMQFGSGGTISALVDNLSYSYKNTSEVSNRLRTVTDAITGDNKLGDFTDNNTSTDDYDYDVNGNLIYDKNKRISLIEYNHLNLPWKITVTDATAATKGTITYIYDAVGNKLEKQTKEFASASNASTETVTQTSYLAGFVYENNKLSFFGQEEGRIRPLIPSTDNGNQSFAFDYFLKDHLGNTRTVLTDEIGSAIYQAGMEDASRNFETALFNNISETVASNNKPPGFDIDATNKNVSQLFNTSAGDKRVGPGIVLKVMAGDKYKASVMGWYQPGATTTATYTGATNLVNGLIAALSGGLVSAGSKGTITDLGNTTGSLNPPLTSFLNDPSKPYNTTLPKAYLNWMLLDEQQFKLVTGSYGAVQIPAITGTMQKQLLQSNSGNDITVTKNGYLYVYVSNESQGNVYFDDIRIQHTKGPLIEETAYYPFGLTMAGISSKAAGKPEGNKKFQGQEFAHKEFSDGSGLEMYEFKWRMDDPQTGRFWQIDPLADKYVYNSPYAFSENKVTNHVELEGLEAVEAGYIFQKAKEEIAGAFQGAANSIDRALSYFTKSEASTVVASTPISTTSVGSSVTTNTNTNFGGNMSFIIGNNTNVGNTEPLTKTTVTVVAETKTDIRISGVTGTNKTGLSNTGVVTNETGVKANILIEGVPATVGGSVSKNSNGQTTAKAEATTNIPGIPVQGTTQLQYSTNGKHQSTSIGVGGQTTIGTTTTKSVFGITFGW